MRLVTLVLLLLGSDLAFTCSPYPPPKLIPPLDPMGEFKEETIPTDKGRFLERLKRSSRIAVVELYIDFHHPVEPYNAQTEFSVLYGWGKSFPRDVKYVRRTTSCGKPEKYKEGLLYVALPVGNDYSLWLLSDIKEGIKFLGEPEYRHTENGIRFK